MHEERRNGQECDTHDHSAEKSELATDMSLLRWKAIGGDGYEDDIVDTEDYLQEQQRDEGNPCLCCCKYRDVHRAILLERPSYHGAIFIA